MLKYVDGFLIAVPKDKIEQYKEIETMCSGIWKEYGALDYVVSLADDVKSGKVTSFPQAVQMRDDETVAFAYITYRDRAHRDEVNAKVMADPRIANMKPEDLPFDGKRMIWGGFQPFICIEE